MRLNGGSCGGRRRHRLGAWLATRSLSWLTPQRMRTLSTALVAVVVIALSVRL